MHKWFVRIILTLFILQMALPVFGLVLFTFEGGGNFSVSPYTQLFTDSAFWSACLQSLVISVLSVALAIVLITPAIWYGYMYYPQILRVIEGFSFISFVIPAVVLGLAYVQFFSGPPLALAGTPALLPFAFTLLGMPYYVQAILNRLRLMDAKTYHDAARSLGSSAWRSLLQIQAPLLRTGIVNGSILVFSMGAGEFTITDLTTGGSYTTLPVYIQVAFGNTPLEGSAMAVFSIVISALLVFLAMGAFGRKRREYQ
ncbi:ABC transporter permease [Alicyclobacillus acidiphilus]|uniref:ABC transporter permease n=1 Tax=Alicyclobacillus acidiphilus TaxID=182455 RepID=UPI00082B13C1|nr:ABC transporter permease subunit [Alicyclobacillus acidiphilus]